ncbi:hypothetical protein M413DRAFT_241691 [Hebeloma cylindrosporum]|uniref:Uncharacterized protein n=1 Tax=Hebeloma cylindrosporum TaxID=76867 RepID=A0A0C2XM10_HEBCY|nr:hypothetical protein M413DRAFT_241691 [Hebeloma cylindrosporum h7]
MLERTQRSLRTATMKKNGSRSIGQTLPSSIFQVRSSSTPKFPNYHVTDVYMFQSLIVMPPELLVAAVVYVVMFIFVLTSAAFTPPSNASRSFVRETIWYLLAQIIIIARSFQTNFDTGYSESRIWTLR